MNKRLVINLTGKILTISAAAFALPLIVSLIKSDGMWFYFLISAAITVLVSLLCRIPTPKNDLLRPREGFATVAICWLSISAAGALPFFLSGCIPHYVDAFFESVSGFTTTGATILIDVESLPPSMLMSRAFNHWFGGMGVLVLSLALIPKMGGRSLYLMRAESTGPSAGKLVPKTGKTAKILYTVYLAMTLALVLILLALGMDWFDALIHSFSTAGTGGFSTYNLSIGQFNSAPIEIVIGIFMFLFGINFTLYYMALMGNFKPIFRNTEFKTYICIILTSVVLIGLNVIPYYGGDVGKAFLESFFQVASISSTTGFSSDNFLLWPVFSKVIIVILMIIGSCAGSTAGGVKVIRIVYAWKSMRREIGNTVNPKRTRIVKCDGQAIDERTLTGVNLFLVVYFILAFGSTVLLSLDGVSFETAFTSSVTMLSNIGPALGEIGPLGNFAAYSAPSKVLMSMLMLIGRLEIFPILMLFSRDTWKKI